MPGRRSKIAVASIALAGLASGLAFTTVQDAAGKSQIHEALGKLAANPEAGMPVGKVWDVHDMDRPQAASVEPGRAATASTPGTAPSDAIVLLGKGSGMDAWNHDKWTPDADGVAQVKPGSGDLKTRDSFGDCQLHVEWMIPAGQTCTGQKGCNSGVFFLDAYEVQIVGNNGNQTYPDGSAGSMYGQYPPLVNPCRPNGEWNVYDMIFTAPRFHEDGSLKSPGSVTVIFNGVVVQNHSTFMGLTAHMARAKYRPHASAGRIRLQDHGDPINFANIWIRPLPERTLAW